MLRRAQDLNACGPGGVIPYVPEGPEPLGWSDSLPFPVLGASLNAFYLIFFDDVLGD